MPGLVASRSAGLPTAGRGRRAANKMLQLFLHIGEQPPESALASSKSESE